MLLSVSPRVGLRGLKSVRGVSYPGTTAVKGRHAVPRFQPAGPDAVAVATQPAEPKGIGRCCVDTHRELRGPGMKVCALPRASQVPAIFVMATLL